MNDRPLGIHVKTDSGARLLRSQRLEKIGETARGSAFAKRSLRSRLRRDRLRVMGALSDRASRRLAQTKLAEGERSLAGR